MRVGGAVDRFFRDAYGTGAILLLYVAAAWLRPSCGGCGWDAGFSRQGRLVTTTRRLQHRDHRCFHDGTDDPHPTRPPAPPARRMEIRHMSGTTTVLIKTSMGDITAELDADKAPLTVANFLSYVKDGSYDGTIFHRVMPGFMIQGGGFTPDMQQKPTRAPVKNEADNGLKNLRGTLAMARTNVVDSATSQFFINVVDNAFLDFKAATQQGYGYAVFGKVTDGMDVVDAIVAVSDDDLGAESRTCP